MSGDRRGRGSATASVLERLMRDADFRARFRADPRAALEEIGMADMAEQLSTISDPMQTLQPRESRSSLAGAAMAAALEGIALLDPSGHLVDAASAAPLGGGGGGGRQSGSVVAPLATADMTGSDAGGMLHGSEFAIPDPEGAPGPNGPMHAGYDLFGRAGAPIRSPVAGTVVEVKQSSGTSGQVFGGTVKVQQSDGKVWVFRHVVPGGLSAGQRVGAGQGIAAISNWDGGAPHTHIELWKNLDGGYRVENMEDPLPALRLAYSAPSQVPSTPVADAASASVVEDGGSGDASDSGPGDSSDDSEDDDGDDSGDDSEDDSEDDGGDDAADGVGDDQPDSVDEQTNNLESSDTGSSDDSDSSDSSDDSGSSDSSDGGGSPSITDGAPTDYPGDDASQPQIAAWMGQEAEKRGLPPELPVMAALTESGMRNLSYGDADSVGFFQMRTSVWDNGPYAGYSTDPKRQLDWFLDQAQAVKELRQSRGQSVTDPGQYGNWIADIERPAEQYRGRYQTHLAEARSLLSQSQKGNQNGAGQLVDAVDAGAPAPGTAAVAALSAARDQLGTPYQWGGSSPATGFDCSGLVQWAYAQAGIRIPRVTYDQIDAPNGSPVGRNELLPGDLVFFKDSSGDVHHVGMSLGGDRFIAAPHTGDVVKISSLKEPYYAQEFAGGRRFVPAGTAGPSVDPAQAAQAKANAIDAKAVKLAMAALEQDGLELRRPGSLMAQLLTQQERGKGNAAMFLPAVSDG